jgi:hypothetical protein
MPKRGGIVSTAGTGARRCPGCDQPFEAVRPSQTHCRPSCKARHQLVEGQRERRLPFDDVGIELFGKPFE